ncbi:MAG: hypothetical protein WA964_06780 [Ilumatobacter sp.]|uniref:hypothetical protein n=1 Tax=Ilumatobacter sp. TaxID=1967498 RepID=UPI003C758F3A
MLVHTDVSTPEAIDRQVACSHERSVEAEVLLHAVHALRREGILTDAECEAKRQRLATRL